MEYLRRDQLLLQSILVPISYTYDEVITICRGFCEIHPRLIEMGHYYLCQFYKVGVTSIMVSKMVGDLKFNYMRIPLLPLRGNCDTTPFGCQGL